MTYKLTINSDLKDQIIKRLSNEGLSPDNIQAILQSDYQRFSSEEDINSKLDSIFENNEYGKIIQGLIDGYTLDEMPKELGISVNKLNAFINILKQHNLSIEVVKAFNKYTIGSNMILAAKRGVSKKQILESIISGFNLRMTEYGFNEAQISQIRDYITKLDYSLPLHQNYQLTKVFLQQYGLSNKYIAAIQSSIKNLDSYYHLDEILENLDKGLKTSLPKSVELYRAVKSSFLKQRLKPGEDLKSLVGQIIEESGYSSTSLLYDTSFAKYDEYDVVFDIYAPEGTQGIQVTPFSSYGNAEQEVLLNSNDLVIVDVIPNVTDKNGKTKIVCKALMLSKDKSGYKEIKKQQNLQQPINIDEDVNDKQFLDYRQKINSILDSLPSEVYAYSSFSVYKIQEQQYMCHHTLEIVMEGHKKQILLEHDFEYTEHFKKGMLEPSIVDFSRRTPINDIKLSPTPNQTPEQIAQSTKSDLYLFGEINNMLSVNNVDTSFAVQIRKQVLQTNPDIFLKRQPTGSELSTTMNNRGFINGLVLACIIGFLCILGIFIATITLG